MIFNKKKEIKNYLQQNGILKLNKLEQLIKVTKIVSCIPWGEGRTIEETLVTKKVGTCTGKHLVLQACYDELGITNQSVVCTFHWIDESIKYPQHIKDILNKGVWEHGHNFVQIKKGNQWIDVDINYNPKLAPYGFRTFPQNWDGQTPFIAVKKIIRRWDNPNMLNFKKELIDSLDQIIKERRGRFLKELISWANTLNKNI
ncbi:hypothetical protein KKF61_04570 [Patescibacteria group bacterium]|nr:hypothetical protein [Patescibacteria group bacterium]MBU0963509.1 hypothetical protein [Patescibacteria group bacterium]